MCLGDSNLINTPIAFGKLWTSNVLSSTQRDQREKSIPWKVSIRRCADDVLITGSHIGDQLTILSSLISNNIRKYQFLKSDFNILILT